MIRNRTYRVLDDGERIEGVWRHAFIKNGDTYYLTDLKIYAYGLIGCWGMVDIEEFAPAGGDGAGGYHARRRRSGKRSPPRKLVV
ncbi:MAG: DUF7638 domain-containing protein [Candidatus Dormibacteria bacterium]